VTERAASSTAILVCQGRAVADGRYAVGRFSDPIARELLDPSDLGIVDDVRAGRVPTRGAERLAYEMVRHVGLTMAPRTIAIDDAIREHAADQVVILGAGLDGRAWRMSELKRTSVFEVDHPASQRDKSRRVAGLVPVAGRVVPVAVDLAKDRLGPALESAGFDRQAATTWVWEGVVPYLTAAEVSATVTQIAELSAPESRIVVNYQTSSWPSRLMRRAMRIVLRLTRVSDLLAGEPWRSLWGPKRMRNLLHDNGFEVATDSDLLALCDGLTDADGQALSSDNRGSRNGRVAMAVRR
jgi:methyltransferase (TIGR00027 family)